MKFNNDWNGKQRTNFNRLLKHHDPDEHKRQKRAFLQKKLDELDA